MFLLKNKENKYNFYINLFHSHKNNLKIFFLGLPSGFLSSFILSTFGLWARDSHINLTILGILTWVSIPYSLKFFFAPFTSYFTWGSLGKKLGSQRLFMIICLANSIIFLFILSFISFALYPWLCFFFAFFICIFATLWDSMVEPYRVYLTNNKNNSTFSAFEVFGYRFGFWFGSVLPLVLAHQYSWGTSLRIMAFSLVFPLITFISLTTKSEILSFHKTDISFKAYKKNLLGCLKFFTKQESSFPLLKLLILFKISDAFCRSMLSYYLCDSGYSKLELASFEKTFGVIILIVGIAFSGWFTKFLGIGRSWPLWVSFHCIKSFLFFLGLSTTGIPKFIFDSGGLLLLHTLSPWGSILSLSIMTTASKNIQSSGVSKYLYHYFPEKDNSHLKNFPKPKEEISFEELTIRLAFLHSFCSALRLIISPIAGFIAHLGSWSIFFGVDMLFSCLGCLFFCEILQRLYKMSEKNQPESTENTGSKGHHM